MEEGNVCFGTGELCGLVEVSDFQKNLIPELKGNVAFHPVCLSVHRTRWRNHYLLGKLQMVGNPRKLLLVRELEGGQS